MCTAFSILQSCPHSPTSYINKTEKSNYLRKKKKPTPLSGPQSSPSTPEPLNPLSESLPAQESSSIFSACFNSKNPCFLSFVFFFPDQNFCEAMSLNSSNPNFDNLLLQTLMGRLGGRPPPPSSLHTPPFLSPDSLEELLFSNLLSDAGADIENDNEDPSSSSKSQLAKEESKLEKEIIRTILNGKEDTLKPNSGQAVTIGEHHICVGFHEEKDSEYRVWEWHGHIMLFDEENGYTPEYIYGNYFERVTGKKLMKKEEVDNGKEDVKEDKVSNLGLRELINSVDSGSNRVVHRNVNAASPRFTS